MVFVTVIWFCAGDGDCYVTMYCVMFTAKLPQSNNEQNQNSIQTTRKQALIVVMVGMVFTPENPIRYSFLTNV